MTTYTITNTSGDTVASISVATTTGSLFPIEIIGQQITPYGQYIGNAQYRMMEHFASAAAPTNPVTGMIWYNKTNKSMSYYDGTDFVTISSAASNIAAAFNMAPTANNIDLSIMGPTPIFTAPPDTSIYMPTGLILQTVGAVADQPPAMVSLRVGQSEDVMEAVSVRFDGANKFAYYVIQGTPRYVAGSETLQLEVLNPTVGGPIRVNARVFGFRI